MAVSAGAGKLAAVQAIMLKQDAEALPVHSETTHEPDSESAIVLAVNFNLPGPQRASLGQEPLWGSVWGLSRSGAAVGPEWGSLLRLTRSGAAVGLGRPTPFYRIGDM